jgi:hypothetical protein
VAAAAEVLPLAGLRARRLAARRAEALDSVLEATGGLGCDLRGSWRWGDFHLDERSGRSCSDVDLWCPAPGLVPATVAVRAGVLRAGAHSVDYEASLTLDASLCFALVNLATARLRYEDDPYLLAKCRLMLARRRVDERYADVAARIGGSVGAGALAMKLGIDHPVARPDTPAPLAAAVDVPPALAPVLDGLLAGRPVRRHLEVLRAFVETELAALDGSHRRYVANKLTRLLPYAPAS